MTVSASLRVVVLLMAAAPAYGCGVQLAIGQQARSDRAKASYIPQTVGVGARALPLRDNGAYVGADLLVTNWAYDGGVKLHEVQATGGYRFNFHPGALELGVDLGAGAPLIERERGTSVYLGTTAAGLIRSSGTHDQRNAYAVAGVLIDAILIGRVGAWGRPIGDRRDEVWDAALQIGIRATLITDIVTSSKRDWEPP